MIAARAAAFVGSFALAGCWLALDLEDKEFTLGSGEGGSGASGGSTTTGTTTGAPDGMVTITPPGQPVFFIDATEVTIGKYAAWFETNPSLSQQETRCAWNTSFEPGACEAGSPCGCMDSGITVAGELAISPDVPVRCVDFCDAVAYCTGIGKHLCGGTQNLVLSGAPDPSNDPAQSEWFYACSNGGTRAFPYGNQFSPQTCEDSHGPFNDRPRNVGTPGCEGGPPGVFDMSGNVEEWIDHCYVTEADTLACFRPGGAYWHQDEDNLDCDLWWEQSTDVRDQSPATGFRCCDDP